MMKERKWLADLAGEIFLGKAEAEVDKPQTRW